MSAHQILSWLAGLALVGGALPSFAADAGPNLVVILADDLGYGDLGCYGADLIETPHIDKLAKRGLRFIDAYAASVCSPMSGAWA